MSTAVMAACWPLQVPPTPKSVLMSLADNANDQGYCWPSIPTICERTCFSERSVHAAIKYLEQAGVVTADRSNGRHTQYVITPAGAAVPQELRPAGAAVTPAGAAVVPPQEPQSPPQELRSNHQEPSKNRKEPKEKTREQVAHRALEKPGSVSSQTWADWLTLRRAKKAPVTKTVLDEAEREAVKAGLTLERFLQIWCNRGSQGLQADWLKPNELGAHRSGPALSIVKPSAAADFRGKTYESTPDDKLPIGLR